MLEYGAYTKIPTYNYGIPVTIPYIPDPSFTDNPALIERSKELYGKKLTQEITETTETLDTESKLGAALAPPERPATKGKVFKVTLDA